MVFTNTAHFDDHSSLPGALILPRNGVKIISGTCETSSHGMSDKAEGSPCVEVHFSSTADSPGSEYVKGDTGNNITGNFITAKAELLLVM